MLEANKNRLFETIFSIYNRNLLKRRFSTFRVSGFDLLHDFTLPRIIYCNHSSWWDGLVAFQISRKAALNSYVMMEEKQLKRYYFFRKLGAFSINRDNPRQALESLNYAIRLLRSKIVCNLWIFPQGEIVSNELRPIFFYQGLSKIVEKVGQCIVTSLSIRYEFLGNFKPEIFVKIAEPEFIRPAINFNHKMMTQNFVERMTINLDELKNDIVNNKIQNYRSII
jgi:1-acyl-sn-glycerol-3-phosphate acyltransferase